MNKKEIDFFYPRLVVRDGEYCRLCAKTPSELGVDKLEIHEIIHTRPLDIEKMLILCHGCNNLNELNVENLEGDRTETPEFKVKRTYRPIFLEYLASEMMKNVNKDGCDFEEIVADGAYLTGRSKQTIINWLYPLYKGTKGPYIEWGGRLYLRGKQPRGMIQELPKRESEFQTDEQEEMK